MEHQLRIFRQQQGRMSLDALATSTGISKASLSRIETGLQQPDFEVIKKLIAFSTECGMPLTADDFVNFPKSTAQSDEAAA